MGQAHAAPRKNTMKHLTTIMILALPLMLAGCKTEHTVNTNSVVEIKPIEIKPIYATIDINVKVQVDRELDSFFDYEETLKPLPAKSSSRLKDIKKGQA